ncbi:LLM class F420-dependent oxidoreductase [Mycolicibacterium madagascariense]|uniref:LLM class F420-dependent oxidoreductase n=1 Tax=Mycolicibacterium madagascariense TaxID=212765 RepID=A0A7I7XDZ5_9MYCO|nr:TIGR03560 family F420-dependent LLM class oxidoreductase [Mycolicibacterium madagascariense]MCV7011347.1 TIGR03560 family F420-dependent LLM class oxidoreductase [Mycolicibacterium madagascariense]BBZ26728.1 LLM class F420-dependent oxidoreductase [Mycolicibacterium madagascariense]
MDFRLWSGPNNGATYDDLLRSAQLAETLGYSGYFLADHLSPFVGDGLPGPTDVWTTLAGLARETSRIRLGPLVTSATFRHPGQLAIVVAQVDAMSGGRVDFGIGAGYFEAEHRAYGIPFPPAGERFDRLEESLEAMTGLWQTPAGQRYRFAGAHVHIDVSDAPPVPLQQPWPPIIVGGTGRKRTPAIAARYADEFNLQTTRRRAPVPEDWLKTRDVAAQIERVRTAAEAAGRDPGAITFSMSAAIGVGRTSAEAADRLDARHYGDQTFDGAAFHGSPAEVVDAFGPYVDMGIDRVYVRAPIRVEALADNFELLAAEVARQLV